MGEEMRGMWMDRTINEIRFDMDEACVFNQSSRVSSSLSKHTGEAKYR